MLHAPGPSLRRAWTEGELAIAARYARKAGPANRSPRRYRRRWTISIEPPSGSGWTAVVEVDADHRVRAAVRAPPRPCPPAFGLAARAGLLRSCSLRPPTRVAQARAKHVAEHVPRRGSRRHRRGRGIPGFTASFDGRMVDQGRGTWPWRYPSAEEAVKASDARQAGGVWQAMKVSGVVGAASPAVAAAGTSWSGACRVPASAPRRRARRPAARRRSRDRRGRRSGGAGRASLHAAGCRSAASELVVNAVHAIACTSSSPSTALYSRAAKGSS